MRIITQVILSLLYGYNYEKKITKASKNIFNKNKEILIYQIKQSLLNINLEKNLNIKNNNLLQNIEIPKRSFHQYLWAYFINTEIFTSHLIFCIAKKKVFFFPLPKEYIKNVSKLIKTNLFISEVLWKLVLIISFFKNLIFIIFSIVNFFKTTFAKTNYILCKALNNSIPNNNINLKLKDFFFWFYRNFNIQKKVVFLHKSKKIKNNNLNNKFSLPYFVKYKTNPEYILFNIYNLKIYFLSLIGSVKFIIKVILKRESHFIILLYEIFKFNLHLKNPNSFEFVLYNNSNMVFRPLWTYAQEFKKKNSVIFYFYSINNEPLLHKITKKIYFDYLVFKILSWDNYILWGNEHLLWLKKRIKKNFSYKLVDFVPFEGQNIFLPKVNKKRLCIFDNPPKNDVHYFQLLNQYNIYNKDYCLSFINNILILTKKLKNTEVFLKVKRNNNTYDSSYLQYTKLLKKKFPNLKIFDQEISAQSLLLGSDLAISIPFTSTAVIANHFSSKSVFYDPSGQLKDKDNILKKIELINNKNTLHKCIKKYLR